MISDLWKEYVRELIELAKSGGATQSKPLEQPLPEDWVSRDFFIPVTQSEEDFL